MPLALLLLLASSVWSAPAEGGHRCEGGEATFYSYGGSRDAQCRSEQEHLCRCRKELRRIPGKDGGWVDTSAAYYDGSRNLCLDSWDHFQCLEKGGNFICKTPGQCVCDAKPRRCVDKDLTAWKNVGCGQGNCEDTRLLQGREPKDKIQCTGGGRWQCVASPKCPKTGKKICSDKDFGPWREAGCGMDGCAAGQMRMLREKKTYLLCDEARYQKCKPDPACAKKKTQ